MVLAMRKDPFLSNSSAIISSSSGLVSFRYVCSERVDSGRGLCVPFRLEGLDSGVNVAVAFIVEFKAFDMIVAKGDDMNKCSGDRRVSRVAK